MANNTDALLTPSMPHSPRGGAGGAGLHAHRRRLRQGRDGQAAGRRISICGQNREIFETIYSMFVYSQPIDGVTVAGELEKNGPVQRRHPCAICSS